MPLSEKAALQKDRTNAAGELQHRHFATIAGILRDYKCSDESRKAHLIEHFADELRRTNPRFDRNRFVAACQ
jgi:hypothetical protein